jgi:hypothetical protein
MAVERRDDGYKDDNEGGGQESLVQAHLGEHTAGTFNNRAVTLIQLLEGNGR